MKKLKKRRGGCATAAFLLFFSQIGKETPSEWGKCRKRHAPCTNEVFCDIARLPLLRVEKGNHGSVRAFGACNFAQIENYSHFGNTLFINKMYDNRNAKTRYSKPRNEEKQNQECDFAEWSRPC
jgi:hypothetical protein